MSLDHLGLRKLARRLAYFERLAVTSPDADERRRALAEAEATAARLRAGRACQRCGTPLEDPVSVAAGLGPDCRRRMVAS